MEIHLCKKPKLNNIFKKKKREELDTHIHFIHIPFQTKKYNNPSIS